jgi:plasmid stabilization system protein ParE
MYKLKYSCFFRDELRSAKLKDEVKKAYVKLKENPFMYPAVPDEYWASKGFRFTMVKNYMLFYKVKEKQINIDRFLYGHRDWMNILTQGD